MIVVAAVVGLGISFAHAGEMKIDFDGKRVDSRSFMEAIKSVASYQNDSIGNVEPVQVGIARPVPLLTLTSAGKKPKSKQQLIKSILHDYNTQILHNEGVERSLQDDGVIVAFKLPGDMLITKNGETLSTISDPALQETIRLALLENDNIIIAPVRGSCTEWVAQQVWQYVLGKLVEKTVQVCAHYAEEAINNHPPVVPENHPYPQASGYSPGCYTHPNGQVVCE